MLCIPIESWEAGAGKVCEEKNDDIKKKG